MAGQLPDSGDLFTVDPSEAAQYAPDLSEDAPVTETKVIGADHPYALIIRDLRMLDTYMSLGKAGMGITGIVLIDLSADAREGVRKRNEARIAHEIKRRGLPEQTTIEQLNEIIDAEHAAMAVRDRDHLRGLLAKYSLESDQT
jgi:hypothetical protein